MLKSWIFLTSYENWSIACSQPETNSCPKHLSVTNLKLLKAIVWGSNSSTAFASINIRYNVSRLFSNIFTWPPSNFPLFLLVWVMLLHQFSQKQNIFLRSKPSTLVEVIKNTCKNCQIEVQLRDSYSIQYQGCFCFCSQKR